MNPPYDGIIFDFNGVLLWDSELQVQAWRQFSAEKSGQPLSEEDIALHIHGRSNPYSMEYVFGRAFAAHETAELIQHKERLYRQLCLAHLEDFKLSPGAIELLDFLVEKGIPHTIATASEITNVTFFIEHLNLARWFNPDHIVYDNGIIRSKPAPDMYLHAAKNLGLAPQACVVVEDSRSGIRAAHAAEIGHIVALGPIETHLELIKWEGVQRVITRLSELPMDIFRV